MSDSNPNLQLAPARLAPLHNGSVYQTGQNNTDNAVNQQMALIGSSGGKKSKNRRKRSKKSRRRKTRKSRKSKKSRKMTKKRRRRKGGDAIKPQVFTPTYPQPPGSVTPNQNSAAITKLFADSAANAEFDGKVGSTSGGKRRSNRRSNKRSNKCRSCMKRHGRKSRKKRGGVRWGCMS